MTAQDHLDLYDELKDVIYKRGQSLDGYTPAQLVFVEALELAALGEDLLKVYTETVQDEPDMPVRSLHAFLLGYALVKGGHLPDIEFDKTYH